MPAKKGTTTKRNTKSTASKKTVRGKKEELPTRAAWKDDPSSVPNQLIPYLLGILALFITVCFISPSATGIVGHGISTAMYGILGCGAVAVPILIFIIALLWSKKVESRTVAPALVFAGIVLLFISALSHRWAGGTESFSLRLLWDEGTLFKGGGVLGGLIMTSLVKTIGGAGMYILTFTVIITMSMGLFGLTPYSIYLYIAYHLHERRERRAEEKQLFEEEMKRRQSSRRAKAVVAAEDYYAETDRRRFDPDVPVDDEEEIKIDEAVFDEIRAKEESESYTDDRDGEKIDLTETARAAVEHLEAIKPRHIGKRGRDIEGTADGDIPDLEAIFTDPEQETAANGGFSGEEEYGDAEYELEIERAAAVKGELDKAADMSMAQEKPAQPVYVMPPISLLKKDVAKKNVDITEELQTNAVKLVETLRSFKVRTKIVNVSRGPAITRYELAPEEGIRVRAIANLVDDISLNLATTGVRIEAPIPGKSAVGIEVPNKTIATVYLRELLDTYTFRSAQSRITASLGVDVAGDPVFLDISKMPHLLIAGATGMGKSVCINSIIVSLLYKATPDEVKLILIDPKKVELNIYNGLPHLLVPVVSDPKKAAGSLNWAVTEMERRFELIEEEGVRNIANYNEITKDDPDKEFLPQIVIIIDELADLMMTAPDDVENSVCRLAQKARAAGMHLIIGTQRPSVDVITGLIKANVPSRIAFTVASQTDSRVVLDMAGAEKLIGRGDMLYAPVGSSKPIRVQGAFVSEQEVEAVVDFIKSQIEGSYDNSVIESIEKEAERCGQGKKGAGTGGDIDGDSESDPMLKAAIELAVDSGKISTSLIQRRLSLGYGRAAKLIDRMENMGIVSPPEGQKPRKVLITRQDYMEMVVNRGEELQ